MTPSAKLAAFAVVLAAAFGGGAALGAAFAPAPPATHHMPGMPDMPGMDMSNMPNTPSR